MKTRTLAFVGLLFLASGCMQISGLDGYSFAPDSDEPDTDSVVDTDSINASDSDSGTDSDGTDTGSDTSSDTSSDTAVDTGTDTDTTTSSDCAAGAAQQCGGDTDAEDVHSFDSCGGDKGIVVNCHDTNAVCENQSAIEARCVCLGNWDSAEACDRCREGFTDNGDACGHAVRYVDPSVAGLTGKSWADAVSDVQSGISECENAILAGDAAICEVWVRAGTYFIYYNNMSNAVQLRPGVQVYGGFDGTEVNRSERDIAGHETILDARDSVADLNRTYHVLTCDDECFIDGITIRNARSGSEDSHGGGIHNRPSAELTIRNCTFENNVSWTTGGAIYNDAGSVLNVEGCDFTSNRADIGGGGAIYNETGSSAVISNSTFLSNSGYEGGGGAIRNNGATLIAISGCTFTGNLGDQGGGGISSVSSTVNISDSVFDDNNIGETGGGAMFANLSTVDIRECTFSNHSISGGSGGIARGGALRLSNTTTTIANAVFVNNVASAMEGYGGGLFVTDGALTVTNCTFAGNRVVAGDGPAYARGAAMYIQNITVTVRNTIIQGNVPVDYQQTYTGLGSILFYYSNVYGIDTTYNNNLDSDPLFVDAAGGDLHLSAGSVCIDSGDGNYAPTTDRDGLARYNAPVVPNTGAGTPNYTDIGAYEYR